MEWRSVQLDRPSCSTSGGSGIADAATTGAAAVTAGLFFLAPGIASLKSKSVLQDRHLNVSLVQLSHACGEYSRFPVFVVNNLATRSAIHRLFSSIVRVCCDFLGHDERGKQE